MTTWVLLRGLAREARHWGDFPSLLRQALPAGDTVLALDFPGNGARCRETSPTRVQDMLDAVRGELAARNRAGPYVVVALSLGAMAAMHWAATAPHQLAGCVLINSSARGSPPWHRLQPRAWLPLVTWLSPGAGMRRREQGVLRLTSTGGMSETLLARWMEIAATAPVTPGNALRQLLAAVRFRAPARMPVPVLVLSSLGDRLVSPRCSAALASAWQAPLRTHPGAGHDLPLDAPRWVVRQILDWQADR